MHGRGIFSAAPRFAEIKYTACPFASGTTSLPASGKANVGNLPRYPVDSCVDRSLTDSPALSIVHLRSTWPHFRPYP